jgi:hypothetical protein
VHWYRRVSPRSGLTCNFNFVIRNDWMNVIIERVLFFVENSNWSVGCLMDSCVSVSRTIHFGVPLRALLVCGHRYSFRRGNSILSACVHSGSFGALGG